MIRLQAAARWSTPLQRRVGVGALGTAQALDVASTVHGLRSTDVVEMNPVAALAMDALGPLPGLLVVALGVSLLVVGVTEAASTRCRDQSFPPAWVRCLGYVPPTVLSTLAAANNLAVAGVG